MMLNWWICLFWWTNIWDGNPNTRLSNCREDSTVIVVYWLVTGDSEVILLGWDDIGFGWELRALTFAAVNVVLSDGCSVHIESSSWIENLGVGSWSEQLVLVVFLIWNAYVYAIYIHNLIC